MTQATTVAARGEVETTHNLVTFSVSLNETASNVPSAKAKLKKHVDALQAALDDMKKRLDLDFVKHSIRASSNVQEQYEWNRKTNENEFKGYLASYSYQFQIDDLDQVSAVYDTLTSQEEVTVQAPYFGLKEKTRDKLNAKALKVAHEKVTARFESECEILGLNPADFEIASWEVTYSDSQRSSRVAKSARAASARMLGGAPAAAAYAAAPIEGAANGGDDAIELVVGQAVVSANLEVGFARKADTTRTVKAEVVGAKGVRVSNGESATA